MFNNMRILIIGFGSIGKRHYNNLTTLGYRKISIFEPDEKQIKGFNFDRINKLSIKLLSDFNLVFICTPNNLHIKQAIIAAKAGCNLFIEKPLSHNLQRIAELDNICQKKHLVTMVGCNLRFHPCLEFIKKYLSDNKLGKIHSIFLEFGYYLPYWRLDQDYRKNYAAKKQSGGGIILDDIHEFDLLFWFNGFNRVLDSKFIYNNSGKLQIETEDNCLASFSFANKVLGLVKCDYLQKAYSRHCKIVGENGNLTWNFKENIVRFENEKSQKKLFQIKNYDFNDSYINELKYFFSCIEKKAVTFNNISMAEKTLNFCVEK